MKPKRAHPEKDLQKAVAQFLERALPSDAWFTSILGGYGKATIRAAGYKQGAPDLIVLYEGTLFAFELKAKRGHLEQAQKETERKIEKAGGYWHEARSVAEVECILRDYGFPLRAKVSA